MRRVEIVTIGVWLSGNQCEGFIDKVLGCNKPCGLLAEVLTDRLTYARQGSDVEGFESLRMGLEEGKRQGKGHLTKG